LNKIKEILSYQLFEYKNFHFDVADAFFILILLVFTKLILRFVKSIINKFVQSGRIDARNSQSFQLLFKYVLYVIVFVIILEIIGVKITILLAGSAALLVGIGLGLQQIFSDIISGIFLLVEGSIKIGDIMELDGGIVGKVTQINLRTSEIRTRDEIDVIVPNHKFIVESVVNWSHNASLTRFHITVGVSYGSDPEKVKELLLECANENKDVSSNKTLKTNVRLINFGDSSLDFQLLFWSKNGFLIENTKSDLRFAVVKKFRENGIEIPFPQRDLHVKSGKLS
jgi:small-conductance mechanosensitive channel